MLDAQNPLQRAAALKVLSGSDLKVFLVLGWGVWGLFPAKFGLKLQNAVCTLLSVRSSAEALDTHSTQVH